jgi:hypothetical protein
MLTHKRILMIDDDPELTQPLLAHLEGVEVLHPQDVTEDNVRAAALLLVDHHITPENWPQRSAYPLTCRPQDGLALAAIIQSHLRTSPTTYSPATAVALLSGRLNEITGLDNQPEHLAALACGLDWAFTKHGSDQGDLAARIKSLADAVVALPSTWPEDPDKSRQEVARLLGIPNEDWIGSANIQIDRCHPPVHDFTRWTHGTAFIRWLAQQILPYRTFLLDRQHLAVRLGVTPSWLKNHLEQNGGLGPALSSARYSGILADFLGPRWWVAGVDTLLWQTTSGEALDKDRVQAWLTEQANETPDSLSENEVLILNENMIFDGMTAELPECVRVWPDDWPIFAETPWTRIEIARRVSRLHAVVLAADLHRLDHDET